MPVHNEAGVIADVVTEWISELDALALDYEILVYDDGSTDDTTQILDRLRQSRPRLVVRRHANRGHGATVLRGYREARGEWILQVDGDGEIPAASFPALWERRRSYDLVLGVRTGRRSSPDRRLVSWMAPVLVWLLFRQRLHDVNTPFRLMRRAAFEPIVAALPDRCVAPNVALCGLAARAKLRTAETPVRHQGRRAGRTSLRGLRVWRLAVRAALQTGALALAERRRRP